MAPPLYRGAFNIGFQFGIVIGATSAILINYGTEKIKAGWGWRISLSTAAIPALILTAGAFFLPDTPISLVQRGGDLQSATELLQKIRGIADVEKELHDLISASETSNAIRHPMGKIMGRRYRPHLVMAIAIPFFQQFTGINVIGFYAPILFRTVGLAESASLLSVVFIAAVSAVSTVISMVLVDRVGRRALFMVGGVQMLISLVVIGGVMATKLGDHGVLSKGYAYLVLVLICIYAVGFGWSWGPLGWLVPSEIFPLEIRSIGQSITVGVSFVSTFTIAQSSLALLCHLKSGIFFLFGGWVIVMTIFVYFLLPETKSLPIEQVDKVWREHWFWKRIVEDGEETKVDVLA